MTLQEAAIALGVETHKCIDWGIDEHRDVPRPTLDIAHEVLQKFPQWWSASSYKPFSGPMIWVGRWHFDDADGRQEYATFEECVTALAERYLEGKQPLG